MIAVALLVTLATSQALAAPQVNILYPGRSYQADASGQYGDNQLSYTGAKFTEQGALKKTADDDYVLVKKGSYEYTSPEGKPVFITYYADETGFHPTGEVIPVAPVPVQTAF